MSRAGGRVGRVAVAVALLAGCGHASPSDARDLVRAWDPGPSYDRVDCATLSTSFEGTAPEECFRFTAAGDLRTRVTDVLTSLGRQTGAGLASPPVVDCVMAAGDRQVGCSGGLDYRGATMWLDADLDPEAYATDTSEPAGHTLLVWVLGP